jgi:hypothetical protein
MAVTVTIEYPQPGATLPPSNPPNPPGVHIKGSWTVDNIPIQKIVCRVIYPPSSIATPLVWAQDADHIAGGKFDVTFAALPEGLNACVQAEIFVQGVAAGQDCDTVEDIDVLGNPPGTMNPPAPIAAPIPPLP